MKGFLRSLSLLCGTVGFGCGMASCGIQTLIYPGVDMEMPDAAYGKTEHAVSITTDDGTCLRGWFFNRGAGTPLVVCYGGNAMNAGYFAQLAAADPTRSYLMMNYRGYGGSEGEPSEELLVKDARFCLAVARRALGTPASVSLIGFSLGSGVATQVAAAEKVDSLVLVCPFDSITSVACNIVPLLPRLLPLDTWDSAAFAPHINCRVSVLRAKYDTIVPADSTDALIRAFKQVPTTVHTFDADHNNIFNVDGFKEILMQQL